MTKGQNLFLIYCFLCKINVFLSVQVEWPSQSVLRAMAVGHKMSKQREMDVVK